MNANSTAARGYEAHGAASTRSAVGFSGYRYAAPAAADRPSTPGRSRWSANGSSPKTRESTLTPYQGRAATPRAAANRISNSSFYDNVGDDQYDCAANRSAAANSNDTNNGPTLVSAHYQRPSSYQSSTSSRTRTPPATSSRRRDEETHIASQHNSTSATVNSNSSGASFMTQVSKTAAASNAYSHSSTSYTSNKVAPKYSDYANVKHPAHAHSREPLLPYYFAAHRNRHLLVLDLDETLVHASASSPGSYDNSFTVDMDTQRIKIYVKHRPYMMEFLRAAASLFEVCVFTASLSKYADQVMDFIDPRKELITHRLFRQHCTEVDGSYVKDMSILGRPLDNVIIVDNSPVAYLFHPDNAIPVISWFDDMNDTELRSMIPLLEQIARSPNAVQGLSRYNRTKLL